MKMKKYHYLAEETKDILEYIDSNYTPASLQKELNLDGTEDKEQVSEIFQGHFQDALWDVDEITGNGWQGGYCDQGEAEQNLYGNWNLLAEAMEEFCTPWSELAKGPVFADLTIRCYLLYQAIDQAFEKLVKDGWFKFAEEEN